MVTRRSEAWTAIDWAIAIYAAYVAVVAVVFRETVAHWPFLVVGHAVLLVACCSCLPAARHGSSPARTTLPGVRGCDARRGF